MRGRPFVVVVSFTAFMICVADPSWSLYSWFPICVADPSWSLYSWFLICYHLPCYYFRPVITCYLLTHVYHLVTVLSPDHLTFTILSPDLLDPLVMS